MSFDLEKLNHFPMKPGVYIMKDAKQIILYIGKAKILKNRIKQYFLEGRDQREMIPFLISKVVDIKTIVTPNEKEALLLENSLIKEYQPKYNILLKDDKTFISLMINHHHSWPMVRLVRYKNKPTDKGLYFGPYISSLAARDTYETMTNLFPLRQCSDEELKRRKRPCLLYSIKKCIAPCVNKCTREDYQAYVQEAIEFLKGNDDKVVQELEKKMLEASENLEFEKASSIYQTIQRIKHICNQGKNITHGFMGDFDAIGLFRQTSHVIIVKLHYKEGRLIASKNYSFLKTASLDEEILCLFLLQAYKDSLPPGLILIPKKLEDSPLLEEILFDTYHKKIEILYPQKGEKKKVIELANENAYHIMQQELKDGSSKESLLLELQEILHLNKCPIRIECFDTSNISMHDPVASLSAFTGGEKDSKRYRLYKIQSKERTDDYSALKEVLLRRFTKAKEENDFPDLIILDGGKGQLNIGIDVLKQLEIVSVDVIALSKENARHDKGLTKEKIFIPDHKEPIILDHTNSLLFFLQNIRDEAHRRAITYHRNIRKKRTFKSGLDEIPGIGPKKKRALMQHFGSIAAIKEASSESLQQVKELRQKDIASIIHHFKNYK
ncbi:MAG: excinuclease ABC subunit UvrC [Chlamydiales bacterium]|nr:excinuclease ABC subunit UvrC [Chlamydiales bacterium]